ncbi:MAG: ABC transporter ATP-binding protein [Flavihumibacter sp.]
MEPVIRLEGLCKSYGGHRVLNDINLTVYPGEVIGYIGPNGAGKSTTVKILCGLLSDFEGTVTVKGHDLRTDTLAVKKIIGYVPEQAELYDSLTAYEFLDLVAGLFELPPALAGGRISSMLQALGLAAVAHQRIDTYSKGMRQKVLSWTE